MDSPKSNKVAALKKGLGNAIMKGFAKNLSPPKKNRNEQEEEIQVAAPESESSTIQHKSEKESLSHLTLNRPKRKVRSPRKRPVEIPTFVAEEERTSPRDASSAASPDGNLKDISLQKEQPLAAEVYSEKEDIMKEPLIANVEDPEEQKAQPWYMLKIIPLMTLIATCCAGLFTYKWKWN